jgi:hypothetical protein
LYLSLSSEVSKSLTAREPAARAQHPSRLRAIPKMLGGLRGLTEQRQPNLSRWVRRIPFSEQYVPRQQGRGELAAIPTSDRTLHYRDAEFHYARRNCLPLYAGCRRRMNCRAPLVGEPRALTLRQPDAPVHALIFGPHLVGAPVTLHVRRHETEQNAAPHAYHFIAGSRRPPF